MNFDSNEVLLWQEEVIIPTYATGKPEKNPMFLEKRVYQGSSGVVYPHAVIESIEDGKQEKTYKAIFLENKYLRIMVLPEIGGRIQMAFDKVKNRHFIYYNQVIKPALVGLTGPWISGGIEFNWPQHHRPSTFDAVDFATEAHADGSKTVWVNEVERMFQTKGMAGFTLYPDKAYLEIRGILYNRTQTPQTFLWWANPAVKVNDDYQSVFPPDVYAVFDHGKRDVSSFPIATGTYYKVDYSPGTDISRYKNIPVPTSYMAIASKYDFMGGYEHDTKGGLLHVANHHLSPGKKQWTWGNGAFGHAWDRNLTDEDGPYIELMTGVFTDNQPDFSWIMPNEERQFVQYFMPYSEIGLIKNATKEAAVNLEVTNDQIDIKVYTMAEYPDAVVQLFHRQELVFKQLVNLAPEHPFQITLFEKAEQTGSLKLQVVSAEGTVLVEYQPEAPVEAAIPEAAEAAKAPSDVDTIEQLYLTGLHLEQYRHATFLATDYYEEGLRRDPKDSRCNNALGLWYFKRGQWNKAEPYFRRAVETLTQRNPNPYEAEPLYNLGLCLTQLERFEEAYTRFYKCTWSAALQDVAYLELARLACRKGAYATALEHIEKSLLRNGHGFTARHLKVLILRKLGRKHEALTYGQESLKLDLFQLGIAFELYQLGEQETWLTYTERMRDYVHSYIDYTLDYVAAGQFADARLLLDEYMSTKPTADAMVYFLRGYLQAQTGNAYEEDLIKAEQASPDFLFPNRLAEKKVLEWVTQVSIQPCPNAYYGLGNFWYAHRQYAEAIQCWETCAEQAPEFPTVWRNLTLAYHNKQQDISKALSTLEKAYALDPSDSRVLMELDQLYKKLNYAPAQRLALLENQWKQTLERDDLYVEAITLHNQLGNHEKALALLAERQFHPWEGGEGKVTTQYRIALTELAKRHLEEKAYDQALACLQKAQVYPHNLGESKLFGTPENDLFYLEGLAYESLKDFASASQSFEKAIRGKSEPAQAIFYNDAQPDQIFYQGLARKRRGEHRQAQELFDRLIAFGRAHLTDEIKLDYFAVSLPDLLVFDADLNERNYIHCQYMMGLGYLGLEEVEQANACFEEVLKRNVNHLGALQHQNQALFLKVKPNFA